MKKISLDAFKSKFMDESKDQLLEELTGGVLGACHCCYVGGGCIIHSQPGKQPQK
ncbi:hypothetical protein [Maribacter sp.]|uniref:hypothetical protein n=1 Tax=Maribacter sp. TaxID=1897614 RepID=UPI0025C64559|nr:hypothetical protein [Maribacter sp.]